MKRMRAEAVNTSWKMLRGARVLGYQIPLEDPTGKETQSEGTAQFSQAGSSPLSPQRTAILEPFTRDEKGTGTA